MCQSYICTTRKLAHRSPSPWLCFASQKRRSGLSSLRTWTRLNMLDANDTLSTCVTCISSCARHLRCEAWSRSADKILLGMSVWWLVHLFQYGGPAIFIYAHQQHRELRHGDGSTKRFDAQPYVESRLAINKSDEAVIAPAHARFICCIELFKHKSLEFEQGNKCVMLDHQFRDL